jgi:cysteine-rich repeat protein
MIWLSVGTSLAAIAAAMLVACGSQNDSSSLVAGLGSQDAASDTNAVTDASDARPPDAADAGDARPPDAATDASDARPDVTSDAGDAGGTDATLDAGAADAGVPDAAGQCTFDAGLAPDGGAVCGDGWRSSTEECDDGLRDASARRGCSTTCQVLDELGVTPVVVDGGIVTARRTLGLGRHPIAAGSSTVGAVYIEPDAPSLAVSLATLTAKATATGSVAPVSTQSTVLQGSNPVVAALPCDRYAVAWTDYGGDGDELGVAVNVVSPGVGPTSPPTFANRTTQASQFDPDIVAIGSQLVVAWVDNSNPSTQPDVRVRAFDGTALGALSDEQTLAATTDSEADVVLANFAGSWAAAWRDDANGLETIRVHAGSLDWTVGPAFLPAPTASKPALAQLDATHLIVAYTVGIAPTSGGTDAGPADAAADARVDATVPDAGIAAASSKIQVAVLSTGAPGTVSGTDIAGTVTGVLGLAQSQPNVATVNGSVLLAWWTDVAAGNPNGEELWLKSLTWNGTTLTTSAAELPLPRWPQARLGDQRSPAMAASPLPSGAVLLAWDDLGRDIASGQDTSDVVLELAPVPLLRTAGDGGP